MAINYLNNKDMLAEIHKSKSTYCSFLTDEDKDFHIILPSVDKINIRSIAEGKRNKAKVLSKKTGENIKPKNFEKTDIVFRIMTYDHIPNLQRKAKPKTIADSKAKVNFPPFQHWRYNDNNELICVGKSHWKDGLQNGKFSTKNSLIAVDISFSSMLMATCDFFTWKSIKILQSSVSRGIKLLIISLAPSRCSKEGCKTAQRASRRPPGVRRRP